MIALYVYLALGLAIIVTLAYADVKEATWQFLGLLVAMLTWPLGLFWRVRNDLRRKAANERAAVRRFERRADELLKRDFEAWWVGLDCKVDRALDLAGIHRA